MVCSNSDIPGRPEARGRAKAPFGVVCLISLVLAACSVSHRKAESPPVSLPPEDLLEGTWLAKEIGGEAVGAGQPTLHFTSDGRANGSGGCNSFTGPVSIDGDAMTFGPLASTRKACLPALLDQEQKFFIALAGVRSFHLDGEQLTLRDSAARPLVQLARGTDVSGPSH